MPTAYICRYGGRSQLQLILIPGRSSTPEVDVQDWRSDIEKWIVLLAVFAFLCLGIVFIASILITKDLADTYRRVGIGVGCVLFAAFWFAISPGNQGRTIQR